jgi:hypothetical protein
MSTTVVLRRQVHIHKRSRAPLVVLGAFVALTALTVTSSTRPFEYRPSKVNLTRVMVRDYAESAVITWRHKNPGRDCPDRLLDLNVYSNRTRLDDITYAWGYDLRMTCDSDGFFRVWSVGDDGRAFTSDDIRSWD